MGSFIGEVVRRLVMRLAFVRQLLMRSERAHEQPRDHRSCLVARSPFTAEELAWFRGPFRERDGND